MMTPGWNINLAEIDGIIFVMGGDPFRDRVQCYDPLADSWETLYPLPGPSGNPIVGSIGNDIYALNEESLWLFETTSDRWKELEDYPESITVMFGSAIINNYFIVPGGQNTREKAVSSVYVYNSLTASWFKSTDLPKPIQLGGIATLNENIFMIGGCNSDLSAFNNIYEGHLVE